MQKVVDISRFVSLVAFLGVLLFVYAYMPEKVGVAAGENDLPNEFIGKETFFYLSLGIFLATNMIFILGMKMMALFPVSDTGFFRNIAFKQNIIQWFGGLGIMINLFFISVVAFLGFFNNADYYHISTFSVFAYVGQALIFIWIVLFFYLLSKRE